MSRRNTRRLRSVDRKTIVTLRGGLGNQLFQYAFAWALKERTGAPVELDSWHFTFGHARPLDLQDMPIELPISPTVLPWWMKHGAATRITDRFPETTGRWLDVYFEPDRPGYDSRYLSRPRRIYHGYWQCPRYFDEHREELRRQFRFRDERDVLAELARIRPGWDRFIAVHIRRGDYLHPVIAAIHGMPELEYYRRERERLRAELGERRTVFFTDDPDWLRDESGLLDDESVTAADFLNGSREEFALMRRAKGLVISNSSFSWWAAYLGEPEMVIAPDYWFRDVTTEAYEILPEGWLTGKSQPEPLR